MHKIDYTNYKKPTDFASFKQGDNLVRIVSSGVMGYQHVMKTANRFVNLGICTEDENCQQCQKGNAPKRCWKWIIYLDGNVNILDAGAMLGNQICDIATEHGDPQEYDLIVNKTGEKLKTRYTVKKADNNTEISPEIMRSISFKKKILINKYFK